jgi:hypothetical protein
MKSNAFAKILESYAKVSPPPNSAEKWSALASIFASAKTKEVAEFVRELQGIAIEPPAETHELGALLPDIRPMQAVALALGKAPFADALEELKLFAEQRSALSIEGIQAALAARIKVRPAKGTNTKRQSASADPTIVPSYNKRLEEALGDEQGFEEVIAALEADQRLNANDFKKLAKAFAGRAGRNKGDALEIIRARHLNLLDARTKSQFNAGQTAA